MKLNQKNKNGSWTLASDYLVYRNEGGLLDPDSWNEIIKEQERISDTTPTHYKDFTINHNAPMTDEYYVVGNLSFYKTVDDAKQSIDGLLGSDKPTSLEAILHALVLNNLPKNKWIDVHIDVSEAIAAIQALIPEKRKLKPIHYYPDVESNREIEAYNEAIDTIKRNFTGQTDNERKHNV